MIITIYLVFAMLAVMFFDLTRYLIPNWLTGSLLVLYPLAVFLAPQTVDWQAGLLALAVMFAVGYGIFALRLMGGGDVKLIIACALWVGLSQLAEFVILFALLGGALSVILWVGRKALPFLAPAFSPPRALKAGEPVPYGVAIAIAFLWMLWAGKIAAASFF